MSKITEIENAIIQMGDGDFQKFCDTFLSSKAQYGLIHGFGIPDLQRRISFLESLMEDVQGMRFIQHAKRIRNRIDMWKSQIKAEEREEIYRKLYR